MRAAAVASESESGRAEDRSVFAGEGGAASPSIVAGTGARPRAGANRGGPARAPVWVPPGSPGRNSSHHARRAGAASGPASPRRLSAAGASPGRGGSRGVRRPLSAALARAGEPTASSTGGYDDSAVAPAAAALRAALAAVPPSSAGASPAHLGGGGGGGGGGGLGLGLGRPTSAAPAPAPPPPAGTRGGHPLGRSGAAPGGAAFPSPYSPSYHSPRKGVRGGGVRPSLPGRSSLAPRPGGGAAGGVSGLTTLPPSSPGPALLSPGPPRQTASPGPRAPRSPVALARALALAPPVARGSGGGALIAGGGASALNPHRAWAAERNKAGGGWRDHLMSLEALDRRLRVTMDAATLDACDAARRALRPAEAAIDRLLPGGEDGAWGASSPGGLAVTLGRSPGGRAGGAGHSTLLVEGGGRALSFAFPA